MGVFFSETPVYLGFTNIVEIILVLSNVDIVHKVYVYYYTVEFSNK